MHTSLFSWDGSSKIQENEHLHFLIAYPLPVLPSHLKVLDVLLELVPISNTLYDPLFRWDREVYPATPLSPGPFWFKVKVAKQFKTCLVVFVLINCF